MLGNQDVSNVAISYQVPSIAASTEHLITDLVSSASYTISGTGITTQTLTTTSQGKFLDMNSNMPLGSLRFTLPSSAGSKTVTISTSSSSHLAPVISPVADALLTVGSDVDFIISAYDLDSTNITFQWSIPSQASFTTFPSVYGSASGEFTWNNVTVGVYHCFISASDGTQTTTSNFVITVTNGVAPTATTTTTTTTGTKLLM